MPLDLALSEADFLPVTQTRLSRQHHWLVSPSSKVDFERKTGIWPGGMSHYSATLSILLAIRARATFLAINQLTISSKPASTARSSGCNWEWVPFSRCLWRYMKQKSFCWHVVPDGLHEEQTSHFKNSYLLKNLKNSYECRGRGAEAKWGCYIDCIRRGKISLYVFTFDYRSVWEVALSCLPAKKPP